MKRVPYFSILFFLVAIIACSTSKTQDEKSTLLFKNVNLIDGNGGPAQPGTDVIVEGGRISETGKNLESQGATVIDLGGKTMMPAMISTHVHIGTLKGTMSSPANYSKENIHNQLDKYALYGILNVQSLGTDRTLLFQNGFYDSVRNGLFHGARMLSAGYGFNSPIPNIDSNSTQNMVFRPTAPEQVSAEMDTINSLGIKMVKIWVDDFNKTQPKMDTSIYKAVIAEAHKRNIRVAAHVYYLADAKKLVAEGVDMLAHSIRDTIVDDAILADMKAKNVVYVPTLVLDKFSYAYGGEAEWINDPFFKESLEPGVYEMITAEKYKNDTKNSPANTRNINGFKNAMINVKKISDAGILVALGTDSGAFPIRTQGFSEHLELQLLNEAGLTPLQVISVATKNAARALRIDDLYGVIESGKVADLLILNGDPSQDIKNTRNIFSVYQGGSKIK